jgi:hypothetical protein
MNNPNTKNVETIDSMQTVDVTREPSEGTLAVLQDTEVHPMILVNDDNYRERMEEYAVQLGQLMAQHPEHASRFGPLYESLRALQTAVQDEMLTAFETLLVQQVYGYHFYTMVHQTNDYKLLPQELLQGLAGLEFNTWCALDTCTGMLQAMLTPGTSVLPALGELLSQLQSAVCECDPEETRRLQEILLPTVEHLAEATIAITNALAKECSTAEVQEAWIEWRQAAEAYDTVFVEAFHEYYVPFGCVKGHHLIHEIDKGIAWLIRRVNEALAKEFSME